MVTGQTVLTILSSWARETMNAASFSNFQVAANREATQRAELGVVPDVVASVPYLETDIYDLAGLLRLGRSLWA